MYPFGHYDMYEWCACTLLLFRMKAVIDFKWLINDCKKDVSKHGSLPAPEIQNGLVL